MGARDRHKRTAGVETLAETLAEDFVPPVSQILGSSGVPERASIVIPCFLVPLQT